VNETPVGQPRSAEAASTYAVAGWVFGRLLGIIYLIAFWSLARQVIGLIGHDGILPARTYMDSVREWAGVQQLGIDRFRLVPTLCWISTSDAFLEALCGGGMALAALLVAGVAPVLVLPLLWLTYLSLSVVGQDFLSFQWDALLLETGFLAIFIVPAVGHERLRDSADPPRLGVWLLLWLLFRLMVGSGAIKLASGDPTWRNLTALTFHFETQPIPTPLSWYAHHLPVWLHKAFTAAALGIELLVPLLILGGRRSRAIACAFLVGLQALIALTGNYAFFNLLAASLCVFLLDDRALVRFVRVPPVRTTSRLRRGVLIAVAVVTLPVSALEFARSLGVDITGVPPVTALAAFVSPFRSINSYGLFAIMTTSRPEIVVEGSDDGTHWKTYDFKYKMGDLKRRPPWVAPHQPRLDWQMWFAALGRYETEPWFQNFCMRLLEGSPDVLGLLDRNPFPVHPPVYVRAVLHQVHFSDASARRNAGVWWTDQRLGDYSPILSLRQ
jgi:lipase maturation factor 1